MAAITDAVHNATRPAPARCFLTNVALLGSDPMGDTLLPSSCRPPEVGQVRDAHRSFRSHQVTVMFADFVGSTALCERPLQKKSFGRTFSPPSWSAATSPSLSLCIRRYELQTGTSALLRPSPAQSMEGQGTVNTCERTSGGAPFTYPVAEGSKIMRVVGGS